MCGCHDGAVAHSDWVKKERNEYIGLFVAKRLDLPWNFVLRLMACLKYLILVVDTMAVENVGTTSGVAAKPRSRRAGSNWVTHMPTLSPWDALSTGRLNICIDFTFRCSFNAGTSTICVVVEVRKGIMFTH